MKKYILTLAAALMTMGAMAKSAPNTMALNYKVDSLGARFTLLSHAPSYQFVGANKDSIQAYKNGVAYGDPLALADLKSLDYHMLADTTCWWYRAVQDTLYADLHTVDAEPMDSTLYATIAQNDYTYDGYTSADPVFNSQEGYPLGLIDVKIDVVDTANVPVSYSYYPGEYFATLTYGDQVAKDPFTIGKANLTVTARDTVKTYGDQDPVYVYDFEGLVRYDEVAVTATRTPGENVGTYTVTPKEMELNEFIAAISTNRYYNFTFNNGTLTIDPKPAIVLPTDTNKVYGSSDPLFAYTVDGMVGEEQLTGVILSREEGENVANYTISASAQPSANPNYALSFETAVFSITPKEATVYAVDTNKVYGSSDPEFTYTATGLVEGDALQKIILTREEGENAGTYLINAAEEMQAVDAPARGKKQSYNPNYTLSFEPATFTITRKDATVKADDNEKVYGSFDPELTYTATGLVGEDQLVNIAVMREEGETVGTYTLTAFEYHELNEAPARAVSENPNYNLSFENGEFTINPMALEEVFGSEDNEFFMVSAAGYCQDDEAGITYSIEAGEPTEYSVTFGTEAKAQGFVDIPKTAMPTGDTKTLDIKIPATCHYGKYSADVYFYNALGLDPIKAPVTFVVNIPAVDIKQLFDDVVAIDNNEGKYTSYQWYHNGELIPGATQQFYQEKGGLTGSYYVEVTVEGLGYEAVSCAEEFEGPRKAPATQKIIRSNELIIITPENHEYNAKGQVIK